MFICFLESKRWLQRTNKESFAILISKLPISNDSLKYSLYFDSIELTLNQVESKKNPSSPSKLTTSRRKPFNISTHFKLPRATLREKRGFFKGEAIRLLRTNSSKEHLKSALQTLNDASKHAGTQTNI